MSPNRTIHARGFTLVELLVVVATLAILASMLLPVLAKAKARAQRTRCQGNLRQLNLSWAMYYQENGGHLAESYGSTNSYSWVLGNMKDAAEAVNTDLIKQGKLYPYNRDTAVYHCPTDNGVMIGEKQVASVRSYSMNAFMGLRDTQSAPLPFDVAGYLPCLEKDSDLKRPSDLWVLLDEDERTINDGAFVIDPAARQWYDMPAHSAHRHVFTFCLSFADGHCDYWRIRDAKALADTAGDSLIAPNLDLNHLASTCAVPR